MSLQLCPIGSVVHRPTTWNPTVKQAGTFSYIDLGSIDNREKSIGDYQEIACATAPSRARQRVQVGDILISTVRPNLNGVGVVIRDGIDTTASTGFCVLRPIDQAVWHRYLFHWVTGPQFVADMIRKATGASYPAVSDRTVLDSLIPIPPLVEQRRIAAILDLADDLRRKRRRVLNRLSDLEWAIFAFIIGDPTQNPYNLPEVVFGDVIVSGPTNGLYKPASAYGSGAPILRIGNFYDGRISDLNALRRLDVTDSELSFYGLAEGDIVINRVNSREYLGKSALIPSLDEPIVFESNMMRVRTDGTRINPIYCIAYLQTDFIKRQIAKNAKDAVNQSSINQSDVKSFTIHLPPLNRQHMFATRIVEIEKLKTHHRAHLARSDALFASIQHRAFRGEL